MVVLLPDHRCRRLLLIALVCCLMLPTVSQAVHLKDDTQQGVSDLTFSVLILGDSQMAGAGWAGGYANCLLETYPNAVIINLAQNGSFLANGDIQEQWERFLSGGYPMPDFILLDGGFNDLPYLRQREYDKEVLSLIRKSLSSLIRQIHEASPDTHIIYLLMPPFIEWKDSDSGPPSYEIQELYWKRMSITADAYDNVTVLDLFSLNPFCFPCADCYHENYVDSLHMNEAGYRKTFEYIDNVLIVHLIERLTE